MAKRKSKKVQTTICKTVRIKITITKVGWTQVLQKGKQLLLHQQHLSCNPSYKPHRVVVLYAMNVHIMYIIVVYL